VVFDNLSGLLNALRVLTSTATGFDVLRVKNKLDFRQKLGYRDCCANVMLSNSDSVHVCELQLHLKPYMEAKHSGGHKAYTQVRTLNAGT